MTSPTPSASSQTDTPVSTPVSVNGHHERREALSPEMVTATMALIAAAWKLYRLWKEDRH